MSAVHQRRLDRPSSRVFDVSMRLLLPALAVVALAAGCGGVENEPNLAAAIEKTEATGSSRIAIDAVEIDGDERANFQCSGQADYERERLEISCDYGGGGTEMIAIGRDTYFRGDVFGIGGSASKWTKIEDDETPTAEISPQRVLAMLRGASQDTRRVGEEVLRGVETVRYLLEVDCEQADLDCNGTTAPVEVWVGEDGLVRRISLGDRSGSGTIEFYDFGVEVRIEPPPAEQVEDVGALLGMKKCAPAFGRPIRVDVALDVLGRQGFSVPGEVDCTGSLATIGNTDAAGSFEQEGQLYCFLTASSPGGAPVEVRRRGADGADVFALHNLTCTLLADSPTGEKKIDKLEAAFAELERTTRP
jgi:hypothetical protein